LFTPGSSSTARVMRCTLASVSLLKIVPSLTSTAITTRLAPPNTSAYFLNVST
jgi:hypothetical protein